MKCQRCNGNGKYNTIFGNTIICDFCYGTGEITYGENDRIEPIGNKKPLTNEEWFDSLSTEEKAKTIICLAVNSMNKKQKGLIENDVNEIIRWLKEKHDDNS